MKKIVLITGASEGIGAATAYLAARQGYTVCVNYRQNLEGAHRVVSQIREGGGQAYAFQADISNEKEVVGLFESIDREVGLITALVNNAAIIEPQQRLAQMSAERLHRVFATNVIGSFLCAREAIRRMSTKNNGSGGSIVNISSMASRLGSPFEYIDYAASKGAIDSMTIGLSKEVAEENIRVNAVRPGTIHTEIHRKAGEPNRAERVKEAIPMKRAGQPEEVAHTILWLLSDEASYITGALVDVSGGR
jgi:NAD(P)-dependent dehydrogenase (short-subunit alcohol dehydrogenase family)